MRFGVGLVGEHHPMAMIEFIEQVERLDFDMLWLTDERFHRDVFVNMTVAATRSQSLDIGCMVTDPFIRHPALTAAASATLDDVSGGRFVLGMGAGISGFRELGVKRDRPAKALREAVELINQLTSGQREVAFTGDIIQFGPGRLDFVPERRTPVYVAGRGPRVLQAAGAVADGVVVGSYATEPGINWALEQARRGAAGAGRDLDALEKVSWLYTSVCDDRGAARDAVRVGVAVALSGSHDILDKIGVELPEAVRRHMHECGYRFDREALTELGALLPGELIERFSVAGTVADVIERLAEIRSLGMGQAALWPFPASGSNLGSMLNVLGKQVLPALRD